MILRQRDHEQQTPPPDWEQITLRGDSYAGQMVNVHRDEMKLTLYAGPRPITYYRSPRGAAEFVAESLLGGER